MHALLQIHPHRLTSQSPILPCQYNNNSSTYLSEHNEASIEFDRDQTRERPFRFPRRRFHQPSLLRNAAVIARHLGGSCSFARKTMSWRGVWFGLFFLSKRIQLRMENFPKKRSFPFWWSDKKYKNAEAGKLQFHSPTRILGERRF